MTAHATGYDLSISWVHFYSPKRRDNSEERETHRSPGQESPLLQKQVYRQDPSTKNIHLYHSPFAGCGSEQGEVPKPPAALGER